MASYMRLQQNRQRRGSNAIEFVISIGPILWMTLAFVQFYFLGQGAYFALARTHARSFKDAYTRTHTHSTNDRAGRASATAQIFMLPIWRPRIGWGATRTWRPPGAAGLGGNAEYRVAGGTKGEWWEVWDPAIGMIGLVNQYMDFPYSSFSVGGLAPYNPTSYTFNTNSMANQANNAQDKADQETEKARQEACADLNSKLNQQIAFRNKADACRNASTYQQMTAAGKPLYYHKNSQGPGNDLYFMVNPPGEDDPNPADLVPAYPNQYYTCNKNDYIQTDSGNYGYSSAAQAQADYNKANQAIAETQAQRNALGC